MKVVVPKKATNTQKIYYYNSSTGKTVDAMNDLYFLPKNIIFYASLLQIPTEQPTNPQVGDVYLNTNDNKVYMYCSDGTWQDTGYDGWNIVENFLRKDELTGVWKNYVENAPNGGIYTASTCPNVIKHFPTYDKDANYAVGDIVEIGLAVTNADGSVASQSYGVPYLCLAANASDDPKDPLTEPLYWQRLPFYNQFAIFDKYLNTTWKTRNQNVHLEYQSNDIDYVAVLNPTGSEIAIYWYNDQATEYEKFDLSTHLASNFTEYFFDGWHKKSGIFSEKKLLNIDGVVIELKGNNNSASGVVVGKAYDIGYAQYGYKKQSRDFSKKVTTDEGYDYLQKGNRTKTYIIKLIIHNDKASEIFDILQDLSSEICLWVLEDGEWVFGYYKDLYMVKANPVFSEYELEIRGVI